MGPINSIREDSEMHANLHLYICADVSRRKEKDGSSMGDLLNIFRGCSRKPGSSDDALSEVAFYLDEDALSVVFSFLPAKAFFRLMLVAKRFHQLSTVPRFLLEQACHNKSASGFFHRDYYAPYRFLLIDPYAGIPANFPDCFNYSDQILASAGGLVFYQRQQYWDDEHGSLCVCNPARRTWWTLPSPRSKKFGKEKRVSAAVIFVYDGNDVAEDYKLICLTEATERPAFQHCGVYDSAANAWTTDEEIDFGLRELEYDHPAVCGETVYWASDCIDYISEPDPYVVSFDTTTKRTEIIPVPEGAVIDSYDDTIKVGMWDDRLPCLIHHSESAATFTLWMLRRNNEGSPQWVKSHEISSTRYVRSFVLSHCSTGLLLVYADGYNAYSYSFKDGESQQIGWLGSLYSKLIPYANTLRQCCKQEVLLRRPEMTSSYLIARGF
ncbi:hypothetical protein B296_00021079 [Ensete ventricosum]|uniref:F-box domain-containing protein n=1 Tax=Ensete ventricosum TaxID=4639 RepID=A0A427ANM2_ENSVE|nr:hypothetical protein B296_00021079 [Ensete ventricosum]